LKKINHINVYFQQNVSEGLNAKQELLKVYSEFSSHIFKPSIILNEQVVNIDSKTRFGLNLDQDLSNYLFSFLEVEKHFNDVFKDTISLDLLTAEKRVEVCSIFKRFLLQTLRQFKHYLPFDDIVLSKIHTLDPLFSTKEDWDTLAREFTNIIPAFYEFNYQSAHWIDSLVDLKERREKFMKDGCFDAIGFYRQDFIKKTFHPLLSWHKHYFRYHSLVQVLKESLAT